MGCTILEYTCTKRYAKSHIIGVIFNKTHDKLLESETDCNYHTVKHRVPTCKDSSNIPYTGDDYVILVADGSLDTGSPGSTWEWCDWWNYRCAQRFSTDHRLNKNAFQQDAYRLLQWRPLDVSAMGCMMSFPVWFHVLSRRRYLSSCLVPHSFWGVYPSEGRPPWTDRHS